VIKFTILRLTEEEIFNYLSDIDQHLIPSLSSRVNIRDYSKKLHQHAVHFCALDNTNLIGIALCYFNDPEGNCVYISSFSVLKNYHNQGIAGKLLKTVVEYAKSEGFEKLSLKVFKNNQSAIMLYKKSGFISDPYGEADDFIIMTNNLKLV